MKTTILVTGGAGYIGSHTVVELLLNQYEVIILDNLSNSSKEVLQRIKTITGKTPLFYPVDISDRLKLREIFDSKHIDGVIHFAGFKAVGESVKLPLKYYANNISGSLVLYEEMQRAQVKKLIFSSSATVYGMSEVVPISEDTPLVAVSPYGFSKIANERILQDMYAADSSWNVVILRYFNPVGAHSSGLIGENPLGVPNNLMPYISQVAVSMQPFLKVFGNDYHTVDGTGVRDYIHVTDLAKGHLKALQYTTTQTHGGVIALNLGTGRGYSVLEVIHAFEQVSGRLITHEFVARRVGDVAICYADPSRALRVLNWQAELGLEDMCRDTWNWQKNNPHGLY